MMTHNLYHLIFHRYYIFTNTNISLHIKVKLNHLITLCGHFLLKKKGEEQIVVSTI